MFFKRIPFLLSILFAGSSFVWQSDPDFQKNFLPEIKGEEKIISHSAYSLCYSEEHEQAKWVAYYLNAEMCNSGSEERSDNFRQDKKIETVSALPEDYKKSGFDRGHLCPAGDMAWNETAMSESFLMSNMSPQVPGFNRGIWKKLETEVREWTKEFGELYIVTAGVLQDSLPVIGTNRVSVPKYYYKVLLAHHKKTDEAIAFIMPNASSTESVFNYAVSIDSVENLTGINFFPALPDSLESFLESKLDTRPWKKIR